VLTHSSKEQYPIYLAYGVLLALTAIAGALVCRSMRQHVLAASEEAAARLSAEQQTSLLQREMNIAGDIAVARPQGPGFDVPRDQVDDLAVQVIILFLVDGEHRTVYVTFPKN
jgi:hypothetical protein